MLLTVSLAMTLVLFDLSAAFDLMLTCLETSVGLRGTVL